MGISRCRTCRWRHRCDGDNGLCVPTCCLQESGSPPMKPELMLDIFHNINRTEIKLAALFDVLTSQCDRHQQNIFITKDRQMRVIDNDQVGGGGGSDQPVRPAPTVHIYYQGPDDAGHRQRPDRRRMGRGGGGVGLGETGLHNGPGFRSYVS